MKKIFFSGCFFLFVSIFVYSQSNCSEEQKSHAKEVAKKTTTPNWLKFEIGRGNFGDCIRHQWMDKMQKLEVKQAIAEIGFTWEDGLRKFKVHRMTFVEDYNFTPIKNSKKLKAIKNEKLEEILTEAFLLKTTSIISSLEGKLSRKNSNQIKGKLYLYVLDDETLPIQLTTSDIEIY